jgi:predicted MFS family arabinose efflux permease
MWMTCMGLGAIIVGVALPRIQQRLPGARLVAASSLVHVAAALAVGLAHSVTVVAVAMGCVGGAWLAVGNGINYSAQVSVPDSLRARGMSLFMTAAMAGSAAGAALFGTVADYTGERNSILILSFTGMLLFLALRRLPLSFRGAEGTVSG